MQPVADRLTALESIMTAVDDQLGRLSTALDNITGDVSRLAADLAEVKDDLANTDPETAARLAPLVERAEAIAASTPEPGPSPDTEPLT